MKLAFEAAEILLVPPRNIKQIPGLNFVVVKPLLSSLHWLPVGPSESLRPNLIVR